VRQQVEQQRAPQQPGREQRQPVQRRQEQARLGPQEQQVQPELLERVLPVLVQQG